MTVRVNGVVAGRSTRNESASSLTSHSTRNMLFRRQILPVNDLAVLLTNQTYNIQETYKTKQTVV